MSEFSQNGIVSTLHDFGTKSTKEIEKELLKFSNERKMELILPCLYSELEGEALPNIVSEIKKIYDPEIPVNIYELGLIYKIEIDNKNKVEVEMTLTSPNCPVAESLPKMVKDNILSVEGVSDVDLKLVWSPPWTKDKMSEAAKLELNL